MVHLFYSLTSWALKCTQEVREALSETRPRVGESAEASKIRNPSQGHGCRKWPGMAPFCLECQVESDNHVATLVSQG